MNHSAYIQFLGTLANENRFRILLSLKEKDMCVSELITELGMNQTTVSHSLKRLNLCGFVNSYKEGKFKYYSINSDTIQPLLELMESHTQNYCSYLIEDNSVEEIYRTRKL